MSVMVRQAHHDNVVRAFRPAGLFSAPKGTHYRPAKTKMPITHGAPKGTHYIKTGFPPSRE